MSIERTDILALMPRKRARSPERSILPIKKRRFSPSPSPAPAEPLLTIEPRIIIKFTQTGPGFYEASDLSSPASTEEDSADGQDGQ